MRERAETILSLASVLALAVIVLLAKYRWHSIWVSIVQPRHSENRLKFWNIT
jgi:hypothetical protein